MANPALTEGAFKRGLPEEERAGWAMPKTVPPAPDTVSPWPPVRTADDTMSVAGVSWATATLLVLLVGSAAIGWWSTEVTVVDGETVDSQLPAMLWPALLVALGLAFLSVFRPLWAVFTAPVYAICEGYVVGAISHLYEAEFDGIVLQAVGLTVLVFAGMLTLFATGRIRLSDRGLRLVMVGTLAVAGVYLLSIVVNLFGGDIGFIHDAGPLGIAFSLVVVGLAIANLLVDFQFIEAAVAARTPKRMEWFAAFGLLITLVWLYLELLRLLAKLRER